jgi:hypothetical protein
MNTDFKNQSVKIREIRGKMLLPCGQQELVGNHQSGRPSKSDKTGIDRV